MSDRTRGNRHRWIIYFFFAVLFNVGIKRDEIVLTCVTRLQTSGASEPCGTLIAGVSHGGNFIVAAQSQGTYR